MVLVVEGEEGVVNASDSIDDRTVIDMNTIIIFDNIGKIAILSALQKAFMCFKKLKI